MSPQPIPRYIERLALKFANEEAERARKANTKEGSQAIARRLEAESDAAGFSSVKEYIKNLTEDVEGVEAPDGTTPTSAFWSHGIPHPDAPVNWRNEHFLDNRYIAEAWAKTQNQRNPESAQTLETTDGGRRLNEMYLFEGAVREALGGEDQGFTYEWARECWAGISETYATAAKGPVVVFAETAHTRSILYNQELPTLHTNEHVGLDNINFAYPAPKEWPKETRTEVGTHAVRAQVQVDDPSLPHYIDPTAYPTQDPAAREAAVDAECAAVTAERSERAAEAATAPTTETKAPEAESPAREAPEQPAAKNPAASIPVWQVGFKPTPVKLEAGASGPTTPSTAPPAPDLEKQSAAPGLE
ncbi:hypothetical protein OG889_19950 [Streptomyces sp. NBC_00481]|uniref:hypothetical protein n=1 Tax=unclassified Streptomyces TaxID=2593676 RepID=UPI002DD8BBB8|nr:MULTISPECIES: hypothetical protein [unclassified Streptomyces]WRY96821.1 hypothetical protein OG889_19950 [Streptomyces sp. NBC_00481]